MALTPITPKFRKGQKVIYHMTGMAYVGEIQGIIKGVQVYYEFRGTHYSKTRRFITVSEQDISHVYEGDTPIKVDSYKPEPNPGEIVHDEWTDIPL